MAAYQSNAEAKFALRGKGAPGKSDFDRITELIFGPENRRSVKYTIDAKGKKDPVTIHCLARHKDVCSVLKGVHKNDVDLSHYDELLGSAAEDVKFLLGVNDSNQKQRWEVLSRAMALDPAITRTNNQIFEDIARQSTSEANKFHLNIKSGSGSFNAVREYGYLVPYLVSKKFFGFSIPQNASFWLKAFIGARNMSSPCKVRLKGDVSPASRMFMWTHMIFGHLFANIGERNAIMRMLASRSAKSFSAHIRDLIQNPEKVADGSLLDRFKKVRYDFYPEIDDESYERMVRSLMFEFSGTMQILVGTSFANILKTIYERNIGLENFLKMLKDHGDVVLDEALRLNPTTESVYRVAKTNFHIGDQQIKQGEYICLMVGKACKDPLAFETPDQFSVDPADRLHRDPLDYLNFGPYEEIPNAFNPTNNTHPCFGQYWARTLLKSMLTGLAQFPEIKATPGKAGYLSKFLGMPDSIAVSYDRPEVKKQNFVTVVSAIPEHKNDRIEDIKYQIEKLNNPASPQARKALDDCNLVHFISINLVEGAKKRINGEDSYIEPNHIFMEISVDGEKDAALEAINEHFGIRLFDIYATAGLVESADQIYDHLVLNSVEMIQSVWPQFYSGSWRNGLGFKGTPGLSIEQIKDEQAIAEFVENNVRDDAAKSPLGVLEETKNKLARIESGPIAKARDRWIDENGEPPVFAEVAGSPWKSTWGKITLAIKATPDVVKVWSFVLFLAAASVIWSLLFQSPNACLPAGNGVSTASTWAFPTKYSGQESPKCLTISVSRILQGLGIAFLIALAINFLSAKLQPSRSSRMGAIFIFIFALVIMVSSLPNRDWGSAYQKAYFFDGVYVNEGIWIISLLATLGLALITLIFEKKSFYKAGWAFLAFGMMTLLLLSLAHLQLRLMATEPSLLSAGGEYGFNLDVLNRWDSASLGQMIFYPLIIATILSSAIFAFNASYPKFRLFTHKKLYKWLFLAIFIFVFLTSFSSPELPNPKKLASFLLSFVLAIPTTLVALALIAGIIWTLLTRSEQKNKPVDRDPDVQDLAKMLEREDENIAQNHMISVQTLLPEQWRIRFFLPLALHLVGSILGKNRYRPGFLASVGTVHFARWVHIANTNKFVFVSNYDGSWESYLEDFITKSATGMTGIWSNCIGFPRTKNLFFNGATDGDRFKRWARKSMKPTSFWYSAYPHLTAEQIRRNSLIRDGLARITTPSDAEAWVNLIGSIPRPAYALQADKIQSLVFGGSGNLKVGRCFVIRSRVEGVDPYFQKWVSDISKHVTFGDSRPEGPAVYLAFSSDGMARLGCGKGLTQSKSDPRVFEDDCIKFPPSFAMGMHHKSRSVLLGDLYEDNKSENWKWGNEENPAHAVLFVYGKTKIGKKSKTIKHVKTEESKAYKKALRDLKKLVADNKLEIAQEIELDRLPETGPIREPFGFVDGISQPLLRGTKQAASRQQSIHTVNPGEFILGYKDNRDFYPPSPQVNAHLDEDNTLPAIPRAQPQRYPRFQSDEEEEFRDLGRNGSYLVIRQLEQDVDGFNQAVKREASSFEAVSDKAAEDMIKAKLMGRWPDGQTLTSCPIKMEKSKGKLKLEGTPNSKPMSHQDNEFLLGAEDPQGHKCPYGSHIRRANPRDGLDVENPDSLEIANRHRILRRGRSYTDTTSPGPDKKGILFVCLNADIERQFEFIQQSWIGSCNFHGLNDEMDPITGQGFFHIDPKSKKRVFRTSNLNFTIQDPSQPKRLNGLKPFVTMRGGGYFFLPGKEALDFIVKSADNPLLAKCPEQQSKATNTPPH